MSSEARRRATRSAPHVEVLVHKIGLGTDLSAYADLLERVYSGDGALQYVVGAPGPVRLVSEA